MRARAGLLPMFVECSQVVCLGAFHGVRVLPQDPTLVVGLQVAPASHHTEVIVKNLRQFHVRTQNRPGRVSSTWAPATWVQVCLSNGELSSLAHGGGALLRDVRSPPSAHVPSGPV